MKSWELATLFFQRFQVRGRETGRQGGREALTVVFCFCQQEGGREGGKKRGKYPFTLIFLIALTGASVGHAGGDQKCFDGLGDSPCPRGRGRTGGRGREEQ